MSIRKIHLSKVGLTEKLAFEGFIRFDNKGLCCIQGKPPESLDVRHIGKMNRTKPNSLRFLYLEVCCLGLDLSTSMDFMI